MPASDCRASEMRRMSMPFRGCASSLWPLILLVAWAAFLASAPVTAEGSVPPTSYEEPNYLAGPEGPQLAPQHASANGGESNRSEPAEENGAERYAVAGFDFNRVATPYIISLWIIIVGLAKIGFHVTPKLSSICPESVVLMILGVLIGILLFYGGIDKPASMTDSGPSFQQPLTPNIFFLYMLPPIVMDAGYHMPNRLFFDNLSSILLYAVLGTIWNALTIGFSLYLCAQTGMFGVEIPLLDTLLFSSIVSAVDPVAVLAVFEEIHVNEVLYILVFGESLLNDAVTVVLYHMFEGYAEMGFANILPVDYLAGFASFFVIALGGTAMGVVWGFAAAFVSRFTHHVKIIEPIFVFVMAYLSYLSAEMFHLSGILALTFCGITMKNYVEENITQTSQTTLKYAMKMLANSSESVIFLFLGVCTVTDTHDWNTMFVILTIVFALVFRALGVILFTAIANRFRLHKLRGIEQFIMAYGGLRGAVAFALVLVVNEHVVPTKKMMVTTIIAIVYFTVFLQGMTVGPLVKILKVPRANKYEVTMNERIHMRLMDHTMAGIEDISGMMVGNYKMRDKFRHFNNKFLKHWFLRDSHERGNSSRKIFETYSRLNLQDAINIVNKQNLLQVYNNNNPPTKSLSSLFRTFTESNLTGLAPPSMEARLAAHLASGGTSNNFTTPFSSIPIDTAPASAFNFDMANVDYLPCHRDMAEAEIHHILTDNMFKPVKRFRKYSKSDLPDHSERPPFQHQARLQIRHLMSQNLKRRHRKRPDGNISNDGSPPPVVGNGSVVRSAGGSNASDQHNKRRASVSGRGGSSPEYDDEGITFTVAKSPTKSLSDSRFESPKTAVEASLPWRRSSTCEAQDGLCGRPDEARSTSALKQEEFPSWIANRDYLPNAYASPTNTLLRKLDSSRQSDGTRIPPVFEIFTISEGALRGANRDNETRGPSDLTQATSTTSPGSTAINLGFVDDEDNPIVSKL